LRESNHGERRPRRIQERYQRLLSLNALVKEMSRSLADGSIFNNHIIILQRYDQENSIACVQISWSHSFSCKVSSNLDHGLSSISSPACFLVSSFGRFEQSKDPGIFTPFAATSSSAAGTTIAMHALITMCCHTIEQSILTFSDIPRSQWGRLRRDFSCCL
jgi:hypothetical protein